MKKKLWHHKNLMALNFETRCPKGARDPTASFWSVFNLLSWSFAYFLTKLCWGRFESGNQIIKIIRSSQGLMRTSHDLVFDEKNWHKLEDGTLSAFLPITKIIMGDLVIGDCEKHDGCCDGWWGVSKVLIRGSCAQNTRHFAYLGTQALYIVLVAVFWGTHLLLSGSIWAQNVDRPSFTASLGNCVGEHPCHSVCVGLQIVGEGHVAFKSRDT